MSESGWWVQERPFSGTAPCQIDQMCHTGLPSGTSVGRGRDSQKCGWGFESSGPGPHTLACGHEECSELLINQTCAL